MTGNAFTARFLCFNCGVALDASNAGELGCLGGASHLAMPAERAQHAVDCRCASCQEIDRLYHLDPHRYADAVNALAASLFSSGGMPHVTSAQRHKHPHSTTEQSPSQASKGHPIMRDSQNKSDGQRVEAGDSAKDGNCSTPSTSTEQLPTVSTTFHPGGSTSGAEPAPSSAVPEAGTGEQWGTPEQVAEGEAMWCALCGDSFAEGKGVVCPDAQLDPKSTTGHRWAKSEKSAWGVARSLGRNRCYTAPRTDSWASPPRQAPLWCALCGRTADPALSRTACTSILAVEGEHRYVSTSVEALRVSQSAWIAPRVLPPKIAAAESDGGRSAVREWQQIIAANPPRWCMFCGGTEGGFSTPDRCFDEQRKADTFNNGAHHFVSDPGEAERFWLDRSAKERPPRPGPSGRSGAWARAEATVNQARREKPPPEREPPVHRSLLDDLQKIFGGRASRERPPPVGMAEALLRAVQAIDAEHWQDADDSLTEAMVHFRAASVLLEEANPPGELIRMRAKVARAAFAADFVADELGAVRELVRREAAKGRAS